MRQHNLLAALAIPILAAALSFGQDVPQLVIDTASLPGGSLGVPYSPQTLTASGGYSYASNVWSIISGQLPGGMTLSSDGIISGTPTTAGTSSFIVQVMQVGDVPSPPPTATQALSIFIAGTALQITPQTLPAGMVGTAYAQTLKSNGALDGDVLTWSVFSGQLPTGLSLSQDGVLSGTPTTPGSYSVWIKLTDTLPSGATRSVGKSYTILIAGSPLTITTNATLLPGSVGAAYAQPMTATGGVPQYSWSIASGALPGGVSLNASTGLISGAPSNAGTFNFQVSVSDQAGTKVSGAFSILITDALAIATPSPLPSGASGTAYSTALSATGGVAPYTWSVATQGGSLPPGLTLDPSTGLLAGTPTAAGSYQFQVRVTDAAGSTASKPLALSIASLLEISTPSPLTGGAIGTAYQLQLAATGGTAPFTWSVTTGALPTGLTLDPATGLIAGTPKAGGTFALTIGVRDAAQSASKPYQLTITAPALSNVTITGLPDTPPPATQPTLGISLDAAYTMDLNGHASLAFTPDSASDDPAVQFTTGGRSADFQIPVGTTQAVFGSSSLGVQTGTVAGTITVTLQVLAAGADVTPNPAPTRVLRIAPAPPVITSAKLTATSTGFSLAVIGYSTTREITGATVHLTPATNTTLATSDFTIALTSVFTTWYQDPTSVQYGSQFSLTIPFAVQNASSAIGSLAVTLANSQGTSTAANATF